jgi:ATP-dependent Clp protease ATP-binding subunit ClpC
VKSEAVLKDVMSRYFAPEFLNRIDEVIQFNPLDSEATKTICNIQLKKVR